MALRFDPAAVRAFLARDWDAVRDAKRAYWGRRMKQGGLGEALAVTDQLRAWRKRLEPSWPSEEEREEDLETHRRVACALAKTTTPSPRAGRSRARRPRGGRQA